MASDGSTFLDEALSLATGGISAPITGASGNQSWAKILIAGGAGLTTAFFLWRNHNAEADLSRRVEHLARSLDRAERRIPRP